MDRLAADQIVGASSAARRLRSLVPRVGGVDAGVLIIGEPGTGREHLARVLHASGPRSGGPLGLAVCELVGPDPVFDELFGGPGSPGLLESCASGTVYLSGVDQLPPRAQGRLARFADEASCGRPSPAPRLVASARRDLGRMVVEGSFRADLFYRLAVVTVRLPPLRDRREDISLLARHFLARSCRVLGKRLAGVSREALELLERHRWEGNLAELETVVERAAVLETGAKLSPRWLPLPSAGAPALRLVR